MRTRAVSSGKRSSDLGDCELGSAVDAPKCAVHPLHRLYVGGELAARRGESARPVAARIVGFDRENAIASIPFRPSIHRKTAVSGTFRGVGWDP
jgi:hypothetical protein